VFRVSPPYQTSNYSKQDRLLGKGLSASLGCSDGLMLTRETLAIRSALSCACGGVVRPFRFQTFVSRVSDSQGDLTQVDGNPLATRFVVGTGGRFLRSFFVVIFSLNEPFDRYLASSTCFRFSFSLHWFSTRATRRFNRSRSGVLILLGGSGLALEF